MNTYMQVTASEFSRNFGRYQDEAQSGKIINITSHGRVVGAFLSAQEIAYFESLKQQARQVHVVGDLSDELVSAIENVEYGAGPR